jgi:hypothetical protein
MSPVSAALFMMCVALPIMFFVIALFVILTKVLSMVWPG